MPNHIAILPASRSVAPLETPDAAPPGSLLLSLAPDACLDDASRVIEQSDDLLAPLFACYAGQRGARHLWHPDHETLLAELQARIDQRVRRYVDACEYLSAMWTSRKEEVRALLDAAAADGVSPADADLAPLTDRWVKQAGAAGALLRPFDALQRVIEMRDEILGAQDDLALWVYEDGEVLAMEDLDLDAALSDLDNLGSWCVVEATSTQTALWEAKQIAGDGQRARARIIDLDNSWTYGPLRRLAIALEAS
jgi:hypothetical protein